MQKRSSLQSDFLDFWRSESCFFVMLEARGPILEARGPYAEDFWDFCDFGGAPAAKNSSLLGTNFAQVGAKFELS